MCRRLPRRSPSGEGFRAWTPSNQVREDPRRRLHRLSDGGRWSDRHRLVVRWLGNVDTIWSTGRPAEWFRGLASFSRLILHDRRGTGGFESQRRPPQPRDPRRGSDGGLGCRRLPAAGPRRNTRRRRAQRLGSRWCDFVTEDSTASSSSGWPADEIENSVDDFRQGVLFVVHEFAECVTDAASRCTRSGGLSSCPIASRGTRAERPVALSDVGGTRARRAHHGAAGRRRHPRRTHRRRIAELLHVQGVEATVEELRLLPYDVVFSERLRMRLAATPSWTSQLELQ